MKLRVSLLLFASVIVISSFAQGHLLLVGGGAEGAWSDPAYGWAVNQATNKKVAIISYYDESQDLPNYFYDLGALEATNVKINSRSLAMQDTLYDYLMKFDFFFLKGGDQSNYYTTYKDTKVTDAISDKYAQGGVIGGTSAGMAILSGISYTAEKRSVYPDEGLLDLEDPDITLRNDFVQILPNYITDTHFIERGRSLRLLAFLARWYKDTGELINGIAADDKMAFCIDSKMMGTAIGTGGISLFFPSEIDITENQFSIDSLASIQLLDSGQYDLQNQMLISLGGNEIIAPIQNEETGNYTVILSGSDPIEQNIKMLEYFDGLGSMSDPVLIVSDQPTKSILLKEYLPATNIRMLEVSNASNSSDSVDLRNAIKRSVKVLFHLENKGSLMPFVKGGPTGTLLAKHVKRNNIITAFIGQSSELAGAYFCTNNITDEEASYRNRLKFESGLGLLKRTFIMSNTIEASTSDYYENNVSSVSFAMMQHKLASGFYLNRGSFLNISPESDNAIAYHHGEFPTVALINDGSIGGFARTRNVIGTDQLIYKVLLEGQKMMLGSVLKTEDENYSFEEPLTLSNYLAENSFKVYPNPSSGYLTLEGFLGGYYQIVDLDGKIISQGIVTDEIDVKSLKTGVYLIIANKSGRSLENRLVIR